MRPVPGDPAAVAALSADLRRRGLRLHEAAEVLRSSALIRSAWSGQAAEAFAAAATDLPAQVRAAATSFEQAGRATATYARRLESVQSRLRRHEHRHDELRREVDDARFRLDAALLSVAPPAPDPGTVAETTRARSRLTILQEELRHEGLALDRLTGEHDDAVAELSAALADAYSLAPARPTALVRLVGRVAAEVEQVRESVLGLVRDNALLIGVVADACAQTAAVLSLLALVPTLQPLAGAAAVAGTAALAGHAALAAAGASGWTEAGLDAVGLVTFGVGTRLAPVVRQAEAAAGSAQAARAPAAGTTAAREARLALDAAHGRASLAQLAAGQNSVLGAALDVHGVADTVHRAEDRSRRGGQVAPQLAALVGVGLRVSALPLLGPVALAGAP